MNPASINPRIFTELNLPDNGTFDLLIVQFKEGYPNSKLTFNFAVFAEDGETLNQLEGVTRKVTGVQKVAQKFLYSLLTKRGSDAVNPDFGTDLSDILTGGNLYSQGYAESIIGAAVSDAKDQVVALTSLEADAGSRLQNVELNSVQIGVNSVSATMTVFTAAGEEAPIFVPFPRFDLGINA